jgi:hypothetical protein
MRIVIRGTKKIPKTTKISNGGKGRPRAGKIKTNTFWGLKINFNGFFFFKKKELKLRGLEPNPFT